MSYSSLADFVEELERDGLLLRVRAEVDAELEIAEISQRVAREAGPALLFERVRGQRLPVLTNLLASSQRILRALGIDSVSELGRRLIAPATNSESNGGASRAGWWRRAFSSTAASATSTDSFEPKLVKTGLCQQVVRLASDVNLAELPALRLWPGESCRSIRAGRLHTLSPETERRAVEDIALAVLDARRLAILWGPHDTARAHFEEHRARGTKMPLAVTLGGDPLYALASLAPWSGEVDPYRWAGSWRSRPVELVRGRTQDLRVPADAEIVVEGVVDPAAALEPGPTIVAPSGYYHTFGEVPVMQVTGITHRANPIFPAVVLGTPPHELSLRSEVAEQLTLPYVQSAASEVVDLALADDTGTGQVAIVAFQKAYAGQARKVASAIWGLAPALSIKVLVLVDASVDPRQTSQVWHRVAANTHPVRDFFFAEGPCGVMDHAAPRLTLGSMVAIDATDKLAGEHPRPWPEVARAGEETIEMVARRWQEYGLNQTSRANP